MRSRLPLVWFILAALCGAILFRTSQMTTDGRAQLSRIEAEIVKEEDSARVLEAEWSYLNEPERLEKLARTHLGLEPMEGRQFVMAKDLDAIITAAGEKKAREAAKPAPVKKKAAPAPAAPPLKASVPPPQASPAPPVSRSAPAPAGRGFGDVMKSLGLE